MTSEQLERLRLRRDLLLVDADDAHVLSLITALNQRIVAAEAALKAEVSAR